MEERLLSQALAALAEAKDHAGSWSALAAICGCTPGNMSQLKKKRSPLPPRYVLTVEAATGVSRHRLRPDIYPVADLSTAGALDAGTIAVACNSSDGMKAARA